MERGYFATVAEIERCTTVDGPGIRTIVFLKGCPLHCLWCHNPENISAKLQMGWDKALCIGCGKCETACKQNAISCTPDGIITDTQACILCGQCVEVCPSKARKQFGGQQSVLQVFDEIRKDKSFYEKTHGGITVSGGEPLSQPQFTKALFRLCREENIHTALDTSGYAPADVLKDVPEETDLVLLDLKQADPALHKQYTGVDPQQIFSNFDMIEELGIPTWIRTPIVPGYTDQEENVEALAKMIAGKTCVERWELLPYHSFGIKKYNELHLPYPLQDVARPTEEKMTRLREIAKNICGTRILVR